ncbi:MAG: methyltransferase domain-containing protein, partial [Patescibacteria group bacterium]|nr:methyltransferase domain-containing protein [Patescibacteria group bacterium]
FESPDHIFSNYAYFASYSESWLSHAKKYVDVMIDRFGFNSQSQIIEIASNDGYLLQYFKEKKIPILGIEPAVNVAGIAEKKGIPTLVEFFSVRTAKDLMDDNKQADLLLGNNVLAHVPNLNDFVAGMKILLKPTGIITMEFPHLLQLMQYNQFDTIYHEHFSYLSLITLQKVFHFHGLTIFNVEELTTHGGSLRIFVKHSDNNEIQIDRNVQIILKKEEDFGLTNISTYRNFQSKVDATRKQIVNFFLNAKKEGKKIVGYGAPAKGNTLLNYCYIGLDFIDYTVDRSPHKQGLYLPGTHIPIFAPEKILETKPDYLIILPWNLKNEIMEQMKDIRKWGSKFVTL